MTDHYFSDRPERTHVGSFHAAARLAETIKDLGADSADPTRNLEHVHITDDSAPPVALEIIYGRQDPETIVDILERSDDVGEIDVIKNRLLIAATVDAR